jgi:hypothetical protein
MAIVEKSRWFDSKSIDSDGVVTVDSAHMDDVVSEIIVAAQHSNIHSTPRSILEVRRILIEHLREACTKPEIAACLQVPMSWREPQSAPLILSSPWTYGSHSAPRNARSSLAPWRTSSLWGTPSYR